MKTTKNLIAVVLAVLLVLSLSTSAFADETRPTGGGIIGPSEPIDGEQPQEGETNPDGETEGEAGEPEPAPSGAGTITIVNPEVGKTYSLYELFWGWYDETSGGITYIVSKDSDMAELAGGEDSPFDLILSGGPAGTGNEYFYVVQKDGKSAGDVRKWLQAHTDELIAAGIKRGEKTAGENDKKIVFDHLGFGYYLIQPGEGTLAIVDTNNENIEVYDKNPRTPGPLVKKTNEVSVAVGDLVDYTISFDAVNYEVTSSADEYENDADRYLKAVTDYFITDKYTGLKFNSISSIKYTYTDEAGEQQTGEIASGSYTQSNDPDMGMTYITIPWASLTEGKYVPLYPDKCKVTISYKMEVLDSAIANDHSAPNTAYLDYLPVALEAPAEDPVDPADPPKPYPDPEKPFDPENPFDPKNPETPWIFVNEDDEIVYTCGINIDKVDGADKTKFLSGAWFLLYKQEGNKKLYYKWDSVNEKVTWVEEYSIATSTDAEDPEAGPRKADNSREAIANVEFDGLDVGTYYLVEVLAPMGYNPPGLNHPFEVKIWTEGTKAEDNVVFKAKVDGSDTSVISVPAKDDAMKTVALVTIENTKGQELPSTGGAGTVAMIAAGSFVALMTAVLLITKKRVYNKGF